MPDFEQEEEEEEGMDMREEGRRSLTALSSAAGVQPYGSHSLTVPLMSKRMSLPIVLVWELK